MTQRPLSLTNRLLSFFLGTLAVVLCGFSVAIYSLAQVYLHRQVAHSLEAATNTLAAAVEVTPQGVEWEPSERTISVGEGPLGGHVDWLVTDERGRVIDRSPGAASGGLIADAAEVLTSGSKSTAYFTFNGARWEIRQRWLHPAPEPAQDPPRPHVSEPADVHYPALAITVGVPLQPVQSALRGLGAGLVSVSLIVLGAALAVGRGVCRRALAPVAQVAHAAEGMDGSDRHARLPSTGTGDELDCFIRSFNGLLDRLQESFDRQQRFTGDASHQLRTPLTAILGQIEVALRRERSAEDYQRVLDSVQGRAQHMRQIIDALLFLARADAEARLPDLETVDLADWIEPHLATWKGHPRANDLQLIIDLEGPGRVSAHPVMLAELLNNLLDNATKYSLPGSPITVHLRQSGEVLTLSVADRGNGIATDELPHLFDPFYRSAESRRKGIVGVGLGLTIAARLAQALEARLEVTSIREAGSCFTVRFLVPVATPAPASAV